MERSGGGHDHRATPAPAQRRAARGWAVGERAARRPRGRAVTAAWLAVGATVPAYEKRPGAGWWIAAGASAVGGGALLGAAYLADGEYRRSSTGAEADEARRVVNGLAGAASGAGVLAVGLGVVAISGSF